MTLPPAIARFLAARSPRERMLLAVGGLLALIWLGHALLWQPLAARNASLRAAVLRQDQALARLAMLPPRGAAAATDPRPIAVIVTATGEAMGLTIRRIDPAGPRVAVALEEAGFDTVLLWIAGLERDSGLRLVDLTLTRRPVPGVVAASLTLEKAAR